MSEDGKCSMTSCASGVDDEGARFRFPFFFFFCAQASRVSFAARLYSLSQNPCAVYGFSNDDASGGWYQKLRATCAPVELTSWNHPAGK